VEGLTVTYMPRSLGTHQADTIQQRARWFGYKEEYLGFCRVFLPADAIQAYLMYVDHEEKLRKQIAKYLSSGKPLKAWKRAFFLDPSLKPTRSAVVGPALFRGNFGVGDWFDPERPYVDADAVRTNRELIDRFVRDHAASWLEWPGHPKRTQATRHNVINDFPLSQLHSELLTSVRHAWLRDSMAYTGLLLQISDYLDTHPRALCTIVHMDPQGAREVRSLDQDGDVQNLFQGPNYDNSQQPRVETYPGDRQIRDPLNLTIQLHHLTRVLGVKGKGDVVGSDVWLVAAHVGKGMEAGWVVQAQLPPGDEQD
jgi:hypothetical protein